MPAIGARSKPRAKRLEHEVSFETGEREACVGRDTEESHGLQSGGFGQFAREFAALRGGTQRTEFASGFGDAIHRGLIHFDRTAESRTALARSGGAQSNDQIVEAQGGMPRCFADRAQRQRGVECFNRSGEDQIFLIGKYEDGIDAREAAEKAHVIFNRFARFDARLCRM